jgi:peptidoglycan/xylan/chitin deacetylase (PgdA/CDA1 family)
MKHNHNQIFNVLFAAIIFFIVIVKYFPLPVDKQDFKTLVSRVQRSIKNRFEHCPKEFLRIKLPDGYLCRDQLEPSVYLNIYDNYPLHPDGREHVYTFLDQGEIKIADIYMDDYIYVERFPPVKETPPLTWQEDPYDENYWRFIYYSLRSTRHLLYAARETNNKAYSNKLIEIVDSFLLDGMNENVAWEDPHAVAFRTMVLTNTWWKLRELNELPVDTSTRLLQALEVHARYLMKEENFEDQDNHGITEASALVVLAMSFPDLAGSAEWKSIGSERLNRLIMTLVDEDGVLVENSPYYHFYSLQKFWEIKQYADTFGVPLNREFRSRLNQMIVYATHILQPDLGIPQLGASLESYAHYTNENKQMAEVNNNFLYVLTKGEKGIAPPDRNLVLPSSGQTIMRSSWGEKQSYENQTQVVFDYGPYRTSHSDLDAMNLVIYGNGHQLLVDPGLYTYEPGDYRSYFNGTSAHNTVIVNGKNQLKGTGYAGEFYSGSDYAYQSAYHFLYSDVVHHRAVALLGSNYVLIIDHLISPEEQEYTQRFHIFPGAELTIDGLTVQAIGADPSEALTFYQILPDGIQLKTAIGQEDPIDGLCSYTYEETVPCYALSYTQNASTGTFITLIEIGEHDDQLNWAYNAETKNLDIETSYYDYSFNIDFPEINIENPEKATTYPLNLANRQGNWDLEAPPSVTVPSNWLNAYSVDESNTHKIVIHRRTSAEVDRFVAEFTDIDIYSSQKNEIITELPAETDSPAYRLYEQEDYLPILGYHNVTEDGGVLLSPETDMYLSDFIAQVDYATNVLGCRWHTFSDIIKNYVLLDKKIPDHACVMTLDDGHVNNFDVAFPVLEEFGVKASFFVQTGNLNTYKAYMTWKQVDVLYNHGHEIGSHTINSDDLTAADVTREELENQIMGSIKHLQAHGYDVSTFAYPHGLWNEAVIKVLEKSNLVAGRDIEKSNSWRDKRPSTIGWDETFKWHMNYIKPELLSLEDLKQAIGPTGWWQFEEYPILHDQDNDIKLRSSSPPTPSSWAIMILTDPTDSVTSQFKVSGDGQYTIGVFGVTAKGGATSPYQDLDHFKVNLDGMPVSNEPGQVSDCTPQTDSFYCEFYIRAYLEKGNHTITVEATTENVIVDKFRVFREMNPTNLYSLQITEYQIVPIAAREYITLDILSQQVGVKRTPRRLVLPDLEASLLLLLIVVIGLVWTIAKLRLRIKEKQSQ